MNDDDRNVSAREWRAVREGDAHAAPKTSQNNTPESFIVGVGASGALLAGAAIVFVTLVGLVSFNVWPTAQDASTDGNVELSAATPRAPANNNSNTVVPVSAAAGQLAATNVGTSGGSGGAGNGGNNQGGNGKPKPAPAPTPPGITPTPPGITPTPPGGPTGTGDGSTGSGGPVTATKDPSHVVTPTHPSDPHQNTPEGDKGEAPGDVGDGVDIGIIGKPPVDRPPSILPPGDEPPSDQGGSSGDEPPSDQGGSSGDEPSSDQGEFSGDSASSGSSDDDPSTSDGSHGCSHSDHQD
jgi:hypothetical protein